jgi:hypothetical protein
VRAFSESFCADWLAARIHIAYKHMATLAALRLASRAVRGDETMAKNRCCLPTPERPEALRA